LYGKLRTSLQKVELKAPSFFDHSRNHGISSIMDARRIKDKEYDESDPVWKSSLILDQLERFEEQARSAAKPERHFGDIASVPWLDALMMERCKDELVNVSAMYDEVRVVFLADEWYIDSTRSSESKFNRSRYGTKSQLPF
jgi:hypothetical protein